MPLANQYVSDTPSAAEGDMSIEATWHLLDPLKDSAQATLCGTPPGDGKAWGNVLTPGQPVPAGGYVCPQCTSANS